jgi:apolipoprotein N-acyltransferase
VNAALADTLFRRRAALAAQRPLAARLGTALAALAAVLAFGVLVLTRDPPWPTFRVALLQAGVYTHGADPPEKRLEVWERYLRLTREVAAREPRLVAWPSSSVPSLIPADAGLLRQLGALAGESGAALLVGSAGQEKSRPGERKSAVANSAFLISPHGELTGRYDKIRLLPFNEYVPLRGVVRWPRWISSDVVDARAGQERSVFRVGSARFGVLICWENLFSSDFRASAARGVDFMVGMTNEAFTHSEAAHRQMRAMNVMRAVENAVSIVRPATTGLSFVVDPRGRILKTLRDAEGRELESIVADVVELPLAPERSFYNRAGDWLPFLAAALVVAVVLPRRSPSEPKALQR